eukprot:CAMPEP_0185738464 /NCGR_PEP_ID=MMETSP1171-20130828/33061_1 /TAXON_ID=374046 /ORGANISM="Helicotheca tamensis, Strain CCMP826" /LENGTH=416 /DNA_ID=CAMNT_0028409719 /DNA_START=125 /DNA_END=1376 /DNA_ORIENTATION=+
MVTTIQRHMPRRNQEKKYEAEVEPAHSSINNFINENESSATQENNEIEYKSLPSHERATFAFAKLLSPGKTTIVFDDFVSVLSEMRLDFGLSRVELARVFRKLDLNGDGHLTLDEFRAGKPNCPLTKALVESLVGSTVRSEQDLDFPHDDFDWGVSTAKFYSAPMSEDFVGDNVHIRKLLDYDFHNNYTHKRQLYQDRMIRRNVLLEGSSTDEPWLVCTCGPMGAGKGWVLGWMSANGYLPLERISKIDPDAFKIRMPEWPIYQQNSLDLAGKQTHAESGYIAEIAAHLAMDNSMNVWVDGSLRNYEWYAKHFVKVREKWPQYRIAILAITAPDETIQKRLKHREEMTGRHVDPDLQRDSSKGVEVGLRELAPSVDLIAHVCNSNEGDMNTPPILKYVSLIDSSGNWELVKDLTNH